MKIRLVTFFLLLVFSLQAENYLSTILTLDEMHEYELLLNYFEKHHQELGERDGLILIAADAAAHLGEEEKGQALLKRISADAPIRNSERFKKISILVDEKKRIKHARVVKNRIDELYNKGLRHKALESYEELIEFAPERLDWQFDYAQRLMENNRYFEAEQVLTIVSSVESEISPIATEQLKAIKPVVSLNLKMKMAEVESLLSAGEAREAYEKLSRLRVGRFDHTALTNLQTRALIHLNMVPQAYMVLAGSIKEFIDYEVLEQPDFLRLLVIPEYRQWIADMHGQLQLKELMKKPYQLGSLTFRLVPQGDKKNGFWISDSEISNAIYREITGVQPDIAVDPVTQISGPASLQLTVEDIEALTLDEDIDDRSNGTTSADFPVVNVNLSDIGRFCKAFQRASGVKVSLPSTEQWQIACRGDSRGRFSTGDKIDSSDANFSPANNYRQDDPPQLPLAVRSFPANSLGLYDMHGNVAEWTATLKDGKASVKGGSWKDNEKFLEISTEQQIEDITKDNWLGFRIIISD